MHQCFRRAAAASASATASALDTTSSSSFPPMRLPSRLPRAPPMNAESYLRRHGWTPGTSLQPHKAHSLKKPLLISRKVDVLGIGINRHTSVSDQWWLRAFDSSLKALGTGQKGALDGVREHGVRRGGLYGRFVRGEMIEGTIGKRGYSSSVAAGGGGGAAGEQEAKEAGGSEEVKEEETKTTKRKREDDQGGEEKRVKTDEEHDDLALDNAARAEERRKFQEAEAKRHSTKAEQLEAARNKVRFDRVARGKAPYPPREEERQAKRLVRRAIARDLRIQEAADLEAIKQDLLRERAKRGEHELSPAKMKRAAITERHLRNRAKKLKVPVPELREQERVAAEKLTVEQRERNLRQKAFQVGMTVEELLTLPTMKVKKIRKRLLELDALDEETKTRYETRAKEKGMRLEVYYVVRAFKNQLAQKEAERLALEEEQAAAAATASDTADSSETFIHPISKAISRGKLVKLTVEQAQQIMDATDTTAWSGLKASSVNKLPREVREQRRIWMGAKRTLKKARMLKEKEGGEQGEKHEGQESAEETSASSSESQSVQSDIESGDQAPAESSLPGLDGADALDALDVLEKKDRANKKMRPRAQKTPNRKETHKWAGRGRVKAR